MPKWHLLSVSRLRNDALQQCNGSQRFGKVGLYLVGRMAQRGRYGRVGRNNICHRIATSERRNLIQHEVGPPVGSGVSWRKRLTPALGRSCSGRERSPVSS